MLGIGELPEPSDAGSDGATTDAESDAAMSDASGSCTVSPSCVSSGTLSSQLISAAPSVDAGGATFSVNFGTSGTHGEVVQPSHFALELGAADGSIEFVALPSTFSISQTVPTAIGDLSFAYELPNGTIYHEGWVHFGVACADTYDASTEGLPVSLAFQATVVGQNGNTASSIVPGCSPVAVTDAGVDLAAIGSSFQVCWTISNPGGGAANDVASKLVTYYRPQLAAAYAQAIRSTPCK